VLDPTMLEDAAAEALRILQVTKPAYVYRISTWRSPRYNESAIGWWPRPLRGGEPDGLLAALKTREARQRQLTNDRDALCAQRRLKASETARVRDDLLMMAQGWRDVLAHDVANVRPIVAALLKGGVTFAPLDADRWCAYGEGCLTGYFRGNVSVGVTSPGGSGLSYERVFRGEYIRDKYVA
jgi:hypothetical protein